MKGISLFLLLLLLPDYCLADGRVIQIFGYEVNAVVLLLLLGFGLMAIPVLRKRL